MPSLNNNPAGRDEQQKEAIEQLVRQFQQGDRDAFAKIYDHYVEKVYKYFFFKLGQEEAFDLTETVFLKVWENVRNYKKKQGSSFAAWVFRIAHNLLIDHYRFNKINVELDEAEPDRRRENNPVFLTEQAISRDGLRSALSKLKTPYQEVITLAFLNGLENEEIAQVMKKSEGSLRVLKFRALRELKRVLTEMGIKY